jgi:hypothetical protein
MKDTILKIAKCKDGASFYKKYPSEEAFMAKHGAEFRKAMLGANIEKAQYGGNWDYGNGPVSTQQDDPNYFNPAWFSQQQQTFEPINYTPNTNTGANAGNNPQPWMQYNYDQSPNQNPWNGNLSQNWNSNNSASNRFASKNPSVAPKMFGEDFSIAKYEEDKKRRNMGGNGSGEQPQQQKKASGFGDVMGGFAGVVQGGKALQAEKDVLKRMKTWADVSDVTLRAARSNQFAAKPERKYVRPDDQWNVINPDELYPSRGTGTNILAKHGKSLQMGGMMGGGGSGGGGMDTSGQMGGASQLAGGMFGNNAGSQIGGSFGSILGPVGELAGTMIGGYFDKNPGKIRHQQNRIDENMDQMSSIAYGENTHQMFGANMEDGGIVPYNNGGSLKTYDGGYAEPMSQNRYLPGSGETVMFRGSSHDDGGIDITYGNSPVEVERGEPAMELPDGDGATNLTVFGDIKIPKEYISLLGDPNAKGKKFKNYVADLSKTEAKQNKLSDKSITEINDLPMTTPFDKLKMSSLEANLVGTDMKLQSIAEKKKNAARLQEAINSTADEFGRDPNNLMKAKHGANILSFQDGGKVKKFKSEQEALNAGYVKGADGKFRKNSSSSTVTETKKEDVSALPTVPKGQRKDANTGLYGGVTLEQLEQTKKNNPWFNWHKFNPVTDTGEFQDAYNAKAQEIGSPSRIQKDKLFGQQTQSAKLDITPKTDVAKTNDEDVAEIDNDGNIYETVPYERNKLADFYNMVLPFIRPSNQKPLDPRQLAGEMYALSNNALEPVQAQTFQPELDTPYDISYQDQMNANQADFKAISRMTNNPSALSLLSAQKYAANSKVLGDQFRTNQAMRDRVYSGNRATLNNAQIKNLGIFDNQYTRQEEAKSNTKAINHQALNSIASKYAQNDLENRTLATYENLYNYRYDAAGRAINMNPLFQPNMPYIYGSDGKPTHKIIYDKKGNIIDYKPIDETGLDEAGKTPGINAVAKHGKSMKNNNYLNSSVVKDFK